MKNKIITLFLWCLISISFTRAQESSYTLDKLKLIYENLEYKTDSYDDLKERWIITDSYLVREIFDKLFNANAIENEAEEPKPVPGHPLETDYELIGTLNEVIQNDKVSIRCTKRYYDDEIESLEFLFENNLVKNPIKDWIYIKEALGSNLYNKLKGKDYLYVDVTKDKTESHPEPIYGVNLNLLNNSEVSLLSFNTYENPEFSNRWTISAYSRLGNDNINLPFWYKGSLNAGLRLRCVPQSGIREKSFDHFSLALGWEGPLNFPIQKQYSPSSSLITFKDRLLVSASDNLFIGLTYTPLKTDAAPFGLLAIDDVYDQHLQLSAEGSLTLSDRQKRRLPATVPSSFYSVRNYGTVSGKLKHVRGFFDLGLGCSWHNLYHYSINSRVNKLTELDPVLDNWILSVEPGISSEVSILSYSFSYQFNANVNHGVKFYVLKSTLIISKTVGIDFKYFKIIKADNKVIPWHYDDYFVISPIICINN